ncbi:KR domain [Geosmithia morbida]|uniref:KR domain n=1 Tax=Geosmithia morbida TaxID=1094350 RepID=A0A9P4Z208_9HYPO|nr:KR domain [Geosmithia morbida]KAF4125979.1 KR domain [Geosmithia morbida]
MSPLTAISSIVNSKYCAKFPIPRNRSDLSGHIYIVTGANFGLGTESYRHIYHLGVRKLSMAVPNDEKCEVAKAGLPAFKPVSKIAIEVWYLDMDSYEFIKTIANCSLSLPRIDGVLANAGIMMTKFGLSEELGGCSI